MAEPIVFSLQSIALGDSEVSNVVQSLISKVFALALRGRDCISSSTSRKALLRIRELLPRYQGSDWSESSGKLVVRS